MTLALVHSRLAQPAPTYEHRPCHVCGATTLRQAQGEGVVGGRCVLAGDQTGMRWCAGGAEEEPDAQGRLRFVTGAYLKALDDWIGQEVEREMAVLRQAQDEGLPA